MTDVVVQSLTNTDVRARVPLHDYVQKIAVYRDRLTSPATVSFPRPLFPGRRGQESATAALPVSALRLCPGPMAYRDNSNGIQHSGLPCPMRVGPPVT